MDIRRGDIWYIASNYSTIGSEQRAGRPAVIVSNDRNNRHSQTVEVVYLTTQPKRDMPTHVPIHCAGRESTALCEQISSVAKERVGDYLCHVTAEEMAGIESAMMNSLGMDDEDGNDEPPPGQDTRLAEAEARCTVLQKMYDRLLDRLLRAE